MSRISCATLLMTALIAGAACPTVEPPVTREIAIEPFLKYSCDQVCQSTCLACVDALMVYAVDEERRELVEPTCHDIRGRWRDLCDLTTGRPLVLLEGVPTDRKVIIEVRAFRDRTAQRPDAGASQACEPPTATGAWSCDRPSADLMLWGRSQPTDLSVDSGMSLVEIAFECRAGCDCLDIGTKTGCNDDLPRSACLSSTSCAKPCTNSGSCFQNALPCVSTVDGGVCDPHADFGADPRPFCARCQTNMDCADRLCVGRNNADGGFCARSCPNNACPLGARCAPIDERSGFRELP